MSQEPWVKISASDHVRQTSYRIVERVNMNPVVERIESLLSSPFFSFLSFIVAIVVSYALYRKGRRLKEPCWAMRTINIIEGYSAQLSDLEVSFREQRVENLSISRIAFWNQGADTIDASHIPAGSPLQVVARGEVRLLDARILQTNHPAGKFSIELSNAGNYAPLVLDFCDGGQGVVLQIVHTGTGEADVVLTGAVKGARDRAIRTAEGSGSREPHWRRHD